MDCLVLRFPFRKLQRDELNHDEPCHVCPDSAINNDRCGSGRLTLYLAQVEWNGILYCSLHSYLGASATIIFTLVISRNCCVPGTLRPSRRVPVLDNEMQV